MRSKESLYRRQEAVHGVPRSQTPKEPPNKAFGAFVEKAATAVGFNMEHGQSGRARLAEAAGMSVWAIGRIVNGEALPKPENFQHIAAALGLPTRDLLVAAKILPEGDDTTADTNRPNGANQAVRSVAVPTRPETAADLLGVHHPMVRPMLISNMEQAIQLQAQFENRGTSNGAAANEG